MGLLSILAYPLQSYILTKIHEKIIMAPHNPENSSFAYRLIRLGDNWKGYLTEERRK